MNERFEHFSSKQSSFSQAQTDFRKRPKMAIESLAILAISLYSSGVSGYLWLVSRADLDNGYERVPVEDPQDEEREAQEPVFDLTAQDPLDLEMLAFLRDVESKTDQDMLDLFMKL